MRPDFESFRVYQVQRQWTVMRGCPDTMRKSGHLTNAEDRAQHKFFLFPWDELAYSLHV